MNTNQHTTQHCQGFRTQAHARILQNKDRSQHAPRPRLQVPACKAHTDSQPDYISLYALRTTGRLLSLGLFSVLSLLCLSLETRSRTAPPTSKLRRWRFFESLFTVRWINSKEPGDRRDGGGAGGGLAGWANSSGAALLRHGNGRHPCRDQDSIGWNLSRRLEKKEAEVARGGAGGGAGE